MSDLIERLREAHKWGTIGTSMFGEAADEIERLRALLKEGLEVADDLIEKTDLYLGINEAYDRHDKWEKQVREALEGSDE